MLVTIVRRRQEIMSVAFLQAELFHKEELVPEVNPAKFGGHRHASGRRVGLFVGVEITLEILVASREL